MATQISSPQHEYLIYRHEYANEIGEAGERAIRGLIPLILSDLGHALWYHKPHHVNENDPDFDGVFKDTRKRIVIEISNLRPESYINLNRAKQMERDAGLADYKIHIVSYKGCRNPAARRYLQTHRWQLITTGYMVVTEKYLPYLMDYGHPLLLYSFQDHFLIEPLRHGLAEILSSPMYVRATRGHYLTMYISLEAVVEAVVDALDGAPLALTQDVDPLLIAQLPPFWYRTMPLPMHNRLYPA